MLACYCASPDCAVNGCARVRQVQFRFTMNTPPRLRVVEYYPDGNVKRVEYER